MAHQTNIFLKDLIVKCPEVEKTIKSATMITTTLGQSIAFRHAVCLKVKVTVDISSITIWVPTKTIWYSNGMDLKQSIYLANYVKLALITKVNKPYFKILKTIPRIGRLFNDTSTVENMNMADKLLTPLNFATGITKMDNVSLGLIMVVCI